MCVCVCVCVCVRVRVRVRVCGRVRELVHHILDAAGAAQRRRLLPPAPASVCQPGSTGVSATPLRVSRARASAASAVQLLLLAAACARAFSRCCVSGNVIPWNALLQWMHNNSSS